MGALDGLVTRWRQQSDAARQLASSDQIAQAAERLQTEVRKRWGEAHARLLGDRGRDPMLMRWGPADPDVMDRAERIERVPLLFAGRDEETLELPDRFRRLRRRLVILGESGSGKTTLAEELLLELLKHRRSGDPAPVLFSLASWDPQVQPRVQDWLADQLDQAYPALRGFGADAARRLADQGLLPILDGFDEIPCKRRGQVIDRLNKSLERDAGVIVTSRAPEYTKTVHACDALTAAEVIKLEPLAPDVAAAYLEDRLPRHPDESWQ